MIKKRGLGKGLEALLGGESDARPRQEEAASLLELPVEYLRRGRYQPRQSFDEEALRELADSIRSQGVMQPIVVRKIEENVYEIIAGERRWRAAQLSELARVPVVVRQADDESALALSLIENLQREDLNPMEEARALQRLGMEFELTHEEIASAVGKSRTAVTNLLRLNNLNAEVARMLEQGELEAGHARALLTLPDDSQLELARQVVRGTLNVRQTEKLVRSGKQEGSPPKAPAMDGDTRRLQQSLSEKLGQPVQIKHSSRGQGKMIISYSSLDELDGILSRFGEL